MAAECLNSGLNEAPRPPAFGSPLLSLVELALSRLGGHQPDDNRIQPAYSQRAAAKACVKSIPDSCRGNIPSATVQL